MFAAGRLDEGTALLMGVLPRAHAGARSARLRLRLGRDRRGGARRRCPASRSTCWTTTRWRWRRRGRTCRTRAACSAHASPMRVRAPYEAILSNPPLHRGIAEDHALLEQLIADAPAHLAPGGVLQIVVQRRLPLERLLAKHFARTSRSLPRTAATASGDPGNELEGFAISRATAPARSSKARRRRRRPPDCGARRR